MDGYKRGDPWRISDRSGFKVRASKTRKEWTGAIVAADEYEARHPQDFVRGRPDKQTVPDPRPDPTPVYQGPPVTTLSASAAAGATSIVVSSATGFSNGDAIRLIMNSGDTFLTSISGLAGTTFTVGALPGPASSGNTVAGPA